MLQKSRKISPPLQFIVTKTCYSVPNLALIEILFLCLHYSEKALEHFHAGANQEPDFRGAFVDFFYVKSFLTLLFPIGSITVWGPLPSSPPDCIHVCMDRRNQQMHPFSRNCDSFCLQRNTYLPNHQEK